jgi:hypothetical protein|tara:strand:- start:2094 stop:2705 length:612 start_codon:yes stop_codon:yes gene_type:complete
MKVDYMHKLSKTTGDAVLKELLQFKVPTEPKSKSAKSLCYISEQLISNPYPNKQVQLYIDVTGDCLYLYDATIGLIHSFTREVTHHITSQGSIAPVYRNAREMMQARVRELEDEVDDKEKEFPDLNLVDGTLKFNCSDGAFFDAEDTACEKDFLNCLLTPNEVVICADAVRYWGNGNARNGGRALMMLNTMGRAQQKKKEGKA